MKNNGWYKREAFGGAFTNFILYNNGIKVAGLKTSFETKLGIKLSEKINLKQC